MADSIRADMRLRLHEWAAAERYVLAQASRVLSLEQYLDMERAAFQVTAALTSEFSRAASGAVADDLTDELLSAAVRSPTPLDVGVESPAAVAGGDDPYADLVSFTPSASDSAAFDEEELDEITVDVTEDVSLSPETMPRVDSNTRRTAPEASAPPAPEPPSPPAPESPPPPAAPSRPVASVEVARPAAAAVRIGAVPPAPSSVAIAVGSAEDDDEGDFELAPDQGFTVSRHAPLEEEIEVDDASDDVAIDVEKDFSDEPAPTDEAPKGVPAKVVQELYDRAQAAASDGRLEEGAHLYSDVIDADAKHLDAHLSRGRLYLDLGDYSRAMSDFMVAEELDESTPEPRVAIGELYFARKDYRKAIECFDAALEVAPEHAMAFCRRGISHYYRKNFAVALEDLRKAQQLDPTIPNVETYVGLAAKRCR